MKTPTVKNYKTKKIINILIASMTILVLAVFIFDIKRICIFEYILHFRGPACGLTRSIRALLNLDIKTSIQEHFLGIPLFLAIITIYIIYLIDLIFKKDILEKTYNKITKNPKVVIIILIIITLINNLFY